MGFGPIGTPCDGQVSGAVEGVKIRAAFFYYQGEEGELVNLPHLSAILERDKWRTKPGTKSETDNRHPGRKPIWQAYWEGMHKGDGRGKWRRRA